MIRRRIFITALGSTVAWPLVARAQQPAIPMVGFVYSGVPELSTGVVAAFRKGLGESGFTEGRNVTVEFRFAYNDNARLPELMADLVRRRAAVIVTPGSTQAALAAKTAITSIPVVFSVGTDPVEIGLVASLSHPGGNVTGITSLNSELAAKRLGLMLELLPNVERFAVLVNPTNRNADSLTRDAQAAGSAIGRQIEIFAASTSQEVDSAFVSLAKKRADALVVSPDFVAGQPSFATGHAGSSSTAADDLFLPRKRRNWRPHELRIERERARSPSWHLCRPHSQRGGSGQPAGNASGQVRVHLQSANSKSARPSSPGDAARASQRGDRVTRRREVITLIGGAAAWPFAVRAQQAAMPVIGFLRPGSPEPNAHLVAAFRRGLPNGRPPRIRKQITRNNADAARP